MQYKIVLSLLMAGSLIAQSTQESARAALNRGVAAFKGAKYSDAVSEFELAVKLDPANVNTRLYLGTTYMTQWVPGADSLQNIEFANRAEAAFRSVYEIDARDKTALASLASLAFNKAKAIRAGQPERLHYFDEAETWYRKILDVDSNDKTAYYSLGVIAWERFYPALMNARTRLGMKPEDPGPLRDSNIRAELRTQYSRIVEDGMANLNRAITVDPLYSDAMAYLNLLHRERADYSESDQDYKRDIETADGLVTYALAARKRMAESGNSYAPAPPPPAGNSSERIRVGGNVQALNLVYKPVPIYPPLAKQARIQGTIRFTVIIDKQGQVQNVQLMSGHPLLVPSAAEAVKQYTYKPTFLNGQPVEVLTQVDVNFTLTQ